MRIKTRLERIKERLGFWAGARSLFVVDPLVFHSEDPYQEDARHLAEDGARLQTLRQKSQRD